VGLNFDGAHHALNSKTLGRLFLGDCRDLEMRLATSGFGTKRKSSHEYLLLGEERTCRASGDTSVFGRVEMWRGGVR
jgi:hypothetical protein